MCGIAGSVTCRDSRIESDKVLNSLRHRGPDSSDFWTSTYGAASVNLFHTRLAIQDLSDAGQQPMMSKNGRWCLVFNGEIYNHFELRKNINQQFRGHSDTETLVELISLKGVVETTKTLNGMYAFAAYDRKEAKLFLVRDTFGVKPLYFSHSKNEFIFSSEIRGIRQLISSPFEVDEEALKTFLTLRFTPSPQTLIKQVRRLAPGEILEYDLSNDSVLIQTRSKVCSEKYVGNVDDAMKDYQEMLKKVVDRQLLSDVPVGILLSGGIDSALIASMVQERNIDSPTYTVGYESGLEDCEIDDAKETASILGLKNYHIRLSYDDLWGALDSVTESVEEPLGTTSILPMWYLMKRAGSDVKVVLTGQGCDEPWGGYRRYQSELLCSKIPCISLIARMVGLVGKAKRLPSYAERGVRSLSKTNEVDRFYEVYSLFSDRERESLFHGNSSNYVKTLIEKHLLRYKGQSLSSVEKMMRIDTQLNLSDDLLIYGDKVSMAFSVEARVPMLDLELVKFVESLPLNYKVAIGKSKIVHKKMAMNYLPKSIVQRRKKGFQVPFGTWVKKEWKDRIFALLLDENAPHLGLLDKKGIQGILNRHIRGDLDMSRQLFALSSLATWWKKI
ncbi:MAG: asparagine synthase (glutamine-hydrolyzing) [Gammaproteobacteria bacterium]|nr:asparagine synthase (glutamine-hydrolyzing) [Gammaproteobacteria bacterium]